MVSAPGEACATRRGARRRRGLSRARDLVVERKDRSGVGRRRTGCAARAAGRPGRRWPGSARPPDGERGRGTARHEAIRRARRSRLIRSSPGRQVEPSSERRCWSPCRDAVRHYKDEAGGAARVFEAHGKFTPLEEFPRSATSPPASAPASCGRSVSLSSASATHLATRLPWAGAGSLLAPGVARSGEARSWAASHEACVLDAATCAAGGFARETRDAWRAIADATRAPFLDRMNGALAADADGSDRFVDPGTSPESSAPPDLLQAFPRGRRRRDRRRPGEPGAVPAHGPRSATDPRHVARTGPLRVLRCRAGARRRSRRRRAPRRP